MEVFHSGVDLEAVAGHDGRWSAANDTSPGRDLVSKVRGREPNTFQQPVELESDDVRRNNWSPVLQHRLGDSIKQQQSVPKMSDTETTALNKNGDLALECVTKVDLGEDEEETPHKGALVYGIKDRPPIHIMIIAGIQQGLLGLATQLAVAFFVADAVCASNNEVLKAKILSSTLFMDGVTTILMVLAGSRLPIFQGASAVYIIPLLSLSSVEDRYCSGKEEETVQNDTLLANITQVDEETIYSNLRSLQGSLMLAGAIQALFGLTGLIGVLLRFIGPITIVPSMLLIGIYIVTPVIKFVEVHWGMAIMTLAVAVILSMYLEHVLMPVPIWTPSEGFRIIRYPLHQVFAILIAILVGWMVSGILTQAGVFPDDPKDPSYNARTDSRTDVIAKSQWFFFPHPGQFGPPSFNVSAFISFIIATLLAILDSVGDYYACARVCRVPPPPPHAVNRGILIEGICSFLGGAIGCGHGTNSYGGNIGAIGITKVASRWVFVIVGIMYIMFGVIGKFSAVFVSIPYPVLGGALIAMFAIYVGVVISNLEVVSLSSSRNLAIIGMAIFLGLMIPAWITKNPKRIQTGNDTVNKVISMILGNPNLAGTLVACFLDNTVPGNAKDRGIEAWQITQDESAVLDASLYDHGVEVYRPFLPTAARSWKILNYIPFLPNSLPKSLVQSSKQL